MNAALPILVLAAGASSRMRGADKLLEDVGGQPLLAERVETALASGHPVLVALPPRAAAPKRWDLVQDTAVAVIEVANAADGMAASLSAGVEALPEGAIGVMVLLADMPDITGADIADMFEDFDGEAILRGSTADGVGGHPVVFPARDFAALRSLQGDQGARRVLMANADRVRIVSLPFGHALTDLDTPEAWAAWRAEKP